jgi:transposase-like protein
LYLKAGAEQDKTALLVVLGVDEHGHKELLPMESGYRESAASWSEVLRSLKERGLTEAPQLAIGDGALGFWAALDEVFPTTRHQRCWNHRVLNVLDKLPKRLHAVVRKKLRALAEAPTRQECERRRDALCAWLRCRGQASAAACLERVRPDLAAFYDFLEEHWVHLRTSNPIESIIAGVRLRTNASKRLRAPERFSGYGHRSATPGARTKLPSCRRPSRCRPAAKVALGWRIRQACRFSRRAYADARPGALPEPMCRTPTSTN